MIPLEELRELGLECERDAVLGRLAVPGRLPTVSGPEAGRIADPGICAEAIQSDPW